MTIGDRIRKARKAKGYTQKQLGEACGIAEPTIRRYELGKLNPKFETLQKIAKPLGVTSGYLQGYEILHAGEVRKAITLGNYKEAERLLELETGSLHFPISVSELDLLLIPRSKEERQRMKIKTTRATEEELCYYWLSVVFASLNLTGQKEALRMIQKLARDSNYLKSPCDVQEAPSPSGNETTPENKKSPE